MVLHIVKSKLYMINQNFSNFDGIIIETKITRHFALLLYDFYGLRKFKKHIISSFYDILNSIEYNGYTKRIIIL